MVVVYSSDPESELNGPEGTETRVYEVSAIDGETYASDKFEWAHVDYVELVDLTDHRGALQAIEDVEDWSDGYLIGEGEEEFGIHPHWHNWITGEEEEGYFFDSDLPLITVDFDLDMSGELDLSGLDFDWSKEDLALLTVIDIGVDVITWFYNNAIPRISLIPEGSENVEVPQW